MKVWYSTSELVGLPGMPKSQRHVSTKAKREQWQSRKRHKRGGGREFHLDSFPLETKRSLMEAIDTDLPPVDYDSAASDTPIKLRLSFSVEISVERID